MGPLALHASAVRVGERAVIFLGPSGTGKTTMVRLLEGLAEPLALDSIYLLSTDDGWRVAYGDGRAYFGWPIAPEATARAASLHAVVRLQQAPSARVASLAPWETARALTDAYFELPRQREHTVARKRAAFGALAALARALPGLALDSDLSTRVPALLGSALGLWGNDR